MNKITNDLYYVGAFDADLDLFESQYPVPFGVSYNSYILKDEKIAIFDTIDKRKGTEWLNQVKEVLGTDTPDYLIVQHMEPDHSANIETICNLYPTMKIIGNKRTFPMISNFTNLDLTNRTIDVDETTVLSLGKHELHFVFAPMVHWPEVMVTYDSTTGTLFSADAFGRFGSLDEDDDPLFDEAARYYLNIVGKYGMQVTALLNKAAKLDIKMICPLHGPVLTNKIAAYVDKYRVWSSYNPEFPDKVTVAYASIHGNTKNAANILIDALGDLAVPFDLTRCDLSAAVASAFRTGKLVLMCPTYDAGIFTPMKNYLARLNAKGLNSRKVAIVENGSWAPSAGKLMHAEMEALKNMTICEPMLSIRSSVKDADRQNLINLAETIKSL